MKFRYRKLISDSQIAWINLYFAGIVLFQLFYPNRFSNWIVLLVAVAMPVIWYNIFSLNRRRRIFEFEITDAGLVVAYKGHRMLFCWNDIDLIEKDELGKVVICSKKRNLKLPMYPGLESYNVFVQYLQEQAIKHNVQFSER